MGSLSVLFKPRGTGTGGVVGRNGDGRRVLGRANYAVTIHGTGLRVGRKRVFIVVKLSNDNGSALIHYVGQLGRPSVKRV